MESHMNIISILLGSVSLIPISAASQIIRPAARIKYSLWISLAFPLRKLTIIKERIAAMAMINIVKATSEITAFLSLLLQ